MKKNIFFATALLAFLAWPATLLTKDADPIRFLQSTGMDVAFAEIRIKRSYGEADVYVTIRNTGSEVLNLNRVSLQVRASNSREFTTPQSPLVLDAVFESPFQATLLKPGKTATRVWTIGEQYLDKASYLTAKVDQSEAFESNAANNTGSTRIPKK